MKHFRPLSLALALSALALSGCGKPADLECPVPQLRGADGVLKDTSQDIAAYGARFQSGYGGNAIAEAIAAVRQQYPGASNAEITDFLVAAYCPIARQNAVGASAQKASLQQFEAALAANLGQ